MTNTLISKLTVFLSFLFFLHVAQAQTAYRVDQIPDPKKVDGGYVSNPDRILSLSEVADINQTIGEFEQKTKVEVAVVIVNNFDEDQEDFDFAYNLFQRWGIGKKESNNGLLLFIAKDRRKFRFITGTGVEGVLPDATLKHIAQNQLIPAFQASDYAAGITNTLAEVGEIILNPEHLSELNQKFTQRSGPSWMDRIGFPSLGIIGVYIALFYILKRTAPKVSKIMAKNADNGYDRLNVGGCITVFFIIFVSFFLLAFTNLFSVLVQMDNIPIYVAILCSLMLFGHYIGSLSKIRKTYFDNENFVNEVAKFNRKMWWMMIFSPPILLMIIRERNKKKKLLQRFIPIMDANGQPMHRLNRDQNRYGKPYLSPAQQKEEYLKTVLYDIWLGAGNEVKLVAYEGEKVKSFESCPSCGFKTFTKPVVKTISKATYSRQGSAKEIQECKYCSFETFIKAITLPILVASSSSSSSGGSSSSSSSSSSSWGGGSSSGGGTGGSW